jgi:hypothetical protein
MAQQSEDYSKGPIPLAHQAANDLSAAVMEANPPKGGDNK